MKQELVRRDQASGGGFAVHGVQILTSRPTSNESYASSNALDVNGVSFDALRSAVETVLTPNMLNTAQSTMLDREDPTDQADTTNLYGQSMFRDAALIMEGRDAVKCGDYGRYLMWLKLTLPRWATARKHNYVKAILNFLVQLKHETTPAHRLYLLSSLFVSTNGNTFIGYDLALERAIRITKDTFPPHGGRASVEHLAMIGSNVYTFAAIQVSLRDGYRIASLDERHALADLRDTALAMMNSWMTTNALEWRSDRRSLAFEVEKGDTKRADDLRSYSGELGQRASRTDKPSAEDYRSMHCDPVTHGDERLRNDIFPQFLAQRGMYLRKDEVSELVQDWVAEEEEEEHALTGEYNFEMFGREENDVDEFEEDGQII